MRYWCVSTSSENWNVCKSHSLWRMDARYFPTLDKFLKAGDKAVVYTHGGFFVATVEFVGNYFYSEEDIRWTKGKSKFLFPYRIGFRIIRESKHPPRISFSTEEAYGKAKTHHFPFDFFTQTDYL